MFALLGDIKVIELTNRIGGASCAKMLGDSGADVLKIEPPRVGDSSRYEAPFLGGGPDPDRSALFLAYNTNKKGITLNLESETGRDLLKRLVKDVDVVIESYKVGYLDSLGIGYAALKEINAKVILVSITPFGQDGPYRDYITSDLVTQAIGGHLITGGDVDREPMAFPDGQAGFIAGRNGAIASMAAVIFQRQSGKGQHVDISEMEAFAQVWHANGYTFGGRIGGRGGGGGQMNVMDSMHLKAKDGYVTFTTAGTHPKDPMDVWGDFLGEPRIKEKKWKSAKIRREEWNDLRDLVEGKLKNMTMKEFFNKAMTARLAVGMVQSPQEVVDCPHLAFRGSLQEYDHPVVGKLKYAGPGYLADNQNPAAGGHAAPRLGEHNQEIYGKRLGLTDQQIGLLAGAGVI